MTKFKRILKATCLILACLIITRQGISVNALTNSQKIMMGVNGIYYYDPEGNCINNSLSGGGGYAGIISGSDNEAKIWNYFVSAGINGISNNPAAIAGIMGNFQKESSFNPFALSDSGKYHGLYQTDSTSMIAAVDALGDYWDSTNVSTDINDKAIEIELDYLINDKFMAPEKRFQAFVNAALNNNIPNNADGARIYAEMFLVAVERGVNGDEYLTSQEAKDLSDSLNLRDYTNRKWQGVSDRSNYAAAIYNKYASSGDNSSSGDPGSAGFTNTPVITSSNYCYSTSVSPYNSDVIPQYFQCGESWSNLMYGPDGVYGSIGTDICSSGCGPTSFAMMVTVLLGLTITPDQVADVAGKLGMHAGSPGNWQGSSWDITRVLAEYYGLQYQAIDSCDVDTINRYLRDGWMIHTSGIGTAPFTRSGHYIGIAGINSNGEWYIANSASRNNANRYYSPNAVISAGMRCGNVRAIKR